MGTDKYILEGHTPIVCNDLFKWATWFEKADRTVAKTKIGELEVFTVFLGLDYNWIEGGKPLLFETLIFGGKKFDQEQDRYSTWEEAEAGHKKMVEKVKNA